MSEIVNKFLLGGDKSMPGMTNHLLKINKELNNSKKQEAEDTFIKVN